mgnify:FL=1
MQKKSVKTAIVTGAQRGIGAAVVKALINQKINVVMNYLDDNNLVSEFVEEAAYVGVKVKAVQGDVAKKQTVMRLVDCAEEFGGVNYLVSNAAIFPRVALLDMSEDEWDAVLNVNLKACFMLVKAAATKMVKNGGGGSIVTLSSGVAVKGTVDGAHYSASKSGILGLTKSAALELAAHGIRANVIAPGLVDTDQPRGAFSEGEMDRLWQGHPLAGKTEADDIADMVYFLLSDRARRITGQIIHVNGGALMP